MTLPQSPLVSVGITAYDCEAYLAEAIHSVLAQDHANLDIVVVVDASPDRCAAIARGFEPEGVRVIVHDENKGTAAARNSALALFAGQYVCFLDGDDLWTPDHVSALLAGLGDHHMAVGRMRQFLCPQITQEMRDSLRCDTKVVPAMLASGLLARREVCEAVGGFDTGLSVGEFIDWFARAVDRGFTHAIIETIVLHRRIHGRNFSLRNKIRTDGYATVLKRALDRRRMAREDMR